MSLRRRLKAFFRPKRPHTAASIAERLDRIEARMELFGHGGQAVYVGNNRVLTKIIVGGHVFAFLLEADDRLITPWLVVAGAFETPVSDFFLGEVRADSHCLDVGSNFGYFACLSRRLLHLLALGVFASLIELGQLWLPRRVFDWRDIVASLAGLLCAWLLVWLGHRFKPGRATPREFSLTK